MDEISFAQQGWQCPVCKRIYSPLTTMCLYCGNPNVTIGTTSKIDYFVEMAKRLEKDVWQDYGNTIMRNPVSLECQIGEHDD